MSRPIHSVRRVLGVATVVALALTGCTAAGAVDDSAGSGGTTAAPVPSAAGEAPSSSPTSSPAPVALPDVPVRPADLGSLQAQETVPPVALSIGALDVSLPVDPVGVEADGQMEIPPMAERAGWYRFGAAPGEDEGTAVVAAHVDSIVSAGLGPFARLKDLVEGDLVDVTLADDRVVQYEVTSVERTAKPEVTWGDVFVRGGGHRLVLVTCGGTFQREVRSYSDNVIVTAEPVAGAPGQDG